MKRCLASLMCFCLVLGMCTLNVGAKSNYLTIDDVFDEDFYEDLCSMVEEYADDSYFGTISITIGMDEMCVDGEMIPIDTSGSTAYVENGRTMMPIRGIAEAIGADVYYDPYTMTVTVEKDENSVEMTIGENTMEVNGEEITLLSAPQIVNDRTMLPIRDLAQALDCEVSWNNETQTATFTRPLQTKRVIVHSEYADTYGAARVAKGNGKTIMQFETIEEAQASIDRNSGLGYVAEPDKICVAESMSWGVGEMGGEEYYKQVDYASAGEVIVAVIDSGIDLDHPYFKGRLVNGYDFYDNDTNPDSYDANPSVKEHGTHVASTVLDVAGCNPNVKIMPLKIFGAEKVCYDSTAATAMEYAIAYGADVINLSIGGAGTSIWFEEAVALAQQHNVCVVASAGNSALDLRYNRYHPADIDGVITVSNVTQGHMLSNSSNYGEGIVEFAAPGTNIYGARYGGGYCYKTGTSMASPHVAGIYALIKGAHPDMDVDLITQKLMKNSENQGMRFYKGSVFINVEDFEKNASRVAFDDVEVYDEDENTATVYATIEYSEIKPEEISLMLGTSKNSLRTVYTEKFYGSADEIEIEWDIKDDADYKLKSDTTYYGCLSVKQGGFTYTSDVFKFTTLESDNPDPEPEPEPEPEPNPNSALRINPTKYPSGEIEKGKSFGLAGRIKSDCHITDVRSYILDENYNIVQEASGWTTTQTYVIENSALDTGLKFGQLGEGNYYLRFTAEDESGNRVTWTSDMFTVKKKSEESVSSLRILPNAYPSGTLPYGKKFNLSGRIKSDCHITDVRSYMLDENYNVVQEASGWTTTQTYVIEGSALDRGMEFEKLQRGGYYLRYVAEDESGNSVTWTSDLFYID